MRRAALFDELEKIAEASPEGLANRTKFKKWVKNTALVAGGAGAATAATMLLNKAVGPHMGKLWNSLSPTTRNLFAASVGGLSTLTVDMARRKMMEERHKDENG